MKHSAQFFNYKYNSEKEKTLLRKTYCNISLIQLSFAYKQLFPIVKNDIMHVGVHIQDFDDIGVQTRAPWIPDHIRLETMLVS